MGSVLATLRGRLRRVSRCVLQVTLALNDRCKAVNGARILIVGVAYKVWQPIEPNFAFKALYCI